MADLKSIFGSGGAFATHSLHMSSQRVLRFCRLKASFIQEATFL